MNSFLRSSIAILIVLAIGSISGVKGQDQSQRNDQDAKAWSIGKALASKTITEATKGDPVKGRVVFESHCSTCHEITKNDDKGGPGLRGISKKGPHKLSDGTEHKGHNPLVLRKQIVNGGGSMPAVGASLSDREIDAVIAYLLTL